MSEFNLDREQNIEHNIDATGKKWVVYTERGRHFFFVRPEPDRKDAVIPDQIAGRWTKKGLLEDKVKRYVTESWDNAAKADAKAERKRQVAKEYSNAKKTSKPEEASSAA